MSALSNYLRNALLNHALRNVAMAAPTAAVYVALFKADPTVANLTANELTGVSDPGYARVSTAQSDWATPTSGQISNTTIVTFPAATDNWADTVTHFGIYDASTGGNLLFFGPVGAARTVLAGDQLRYAIGGLTITLS
jgi:hypothetical protein